MCVNPVTIRNPYFDSSAYQYCEGSIESLPSRYVSKRAYIQVPCGKCADCKASYFSALLQRAQMEALTSYVYFVTLTYDDKHIPSISFTNEDGQYTTLYYSDVAHIQLLFKRLRNLPVFRSRDLRYIAATEFGTNRFRPHHHLLLFVARRDDDSPSTPHVLERYLQIAFKRLYALNIGTRKNPIYEPLFTYAEKMIRGKLHKNFDLRLVRDYSKELQDNSSINSPESVARSISYILSYVNKPSNYDDALLPVLDKLRLFLDNRTFTRLSRVLRSRVYYSKHFGFGFDSVGSRVYPSVRSYSLTEAHLISSELVNNLPDTWKEFSYLYPHLVPKVNKSIDFLRGYDSRVHRFLDIQDYINSLSISEYEIFRITHKYFPRVLDLFIHINAFDSEGYYPSSLPVTFDDNYQQSIVYKCIRQMVERGLASRVPYLAFEYVADGSVKYVPLCKYFRRYVTTFDDTRRLYDSLNVLDYDDYLSKFSDNPAFTARRANAMKSNADKHESSREFEKNGLFSRINLLKSKLSSIFVPRGDEFNNVKLTKNASKSIFKTGNAE